VKASSSSRASRQHRLDGRELPAEHGGDDVELAADVLGVGLGEHGADRGGDHLAVALRDRASTLRMKCTRQRCQAAPSSTASIAALRPACASLMTSCVPVRPRALSERRNAVQNAPSSLSPTAKPSTSGGRQPRRRWR
jgi:hypothetical protein